MKLPAEVDHSILVPDLTMIVSLSTVVRGFVPVSETLTTQVPPLPHGVAGTTVHVPGVPAIAELTDKDNTNPRAKIPQTKR
jgi:hypothetical protein